ncbi:mannose-6-phosphate isomerase, partial [bacterium]|nr:mannose-6-phosphate isomerase [bacterium]
GSLAGCSLREVITAHPEALLGPGARPDQRFPLLIKFISTADRLSLQVHPPDEYPQEHHSGDMGKTEMWYLMEAAPGAELLIGFKSAQNLESLRAAINQNKFETLLNQNHARAGEVYFIPAGRVHSIGAGILLAEIQQNSDLTFRVDDYNRQDSQGRKRELHVDQALQIMNFTDTSNGWVEADQPPCPGGSIRNLVSDTHFKVEHFELEKPAPGPVSSGFQILIITQGQGRLVYSQGEEKLERGNVLLLPGGIGAWRVEPGDVGVGMLRVWKNNDSIQPCSSRGV